MRPGFKDHFSQRSDDYARHRPRYPLELYRYLADTCARTERAWDCATGNGQAALGLADRFDSVVATDASEAQIRSAIPHECIGYRTARAEDSGLETDSIDLVTVGQALHWFDLSAFFAEAGRVLREDGVLAVWCYELCEVSAACDAVVGRLYEDIVGEFWPPERTFIETGYRSVDLPGTELESPSFRMSLDWTVQDMLGYLRTWSACKRYASRHGADPVSEIEAELTDAWGAGRLGVSWPLSVRVCRPNAVD